MIKLIFTVAKYTAFTIGVLVLSQVKISGKRVCDHVWGVVGSIEVIEKLNEVSKRINLTASTRPEYRGIVKRTLGQISGIKKIEEASPPAMVDEAPMENIDSKTDRKKLNQILKK